jgi:hypothetical protein
MKKKSAGLESDTFGMASDTDNHLTVVTIKELGHFYLTGQHQTNISIYAWK